ncbi:Lipase [Balamuthia mandrillaris]
MALAFSRVVLAVCLCWSLAQVLASVGVHEELAVPSVVLRRWAEAPRPTFTDAQLLGLLKGDPDQNRDVCGIIMDKGYACERRQVVTEDGYILTVHRIPSTSNDKKVPPKVALLQHGLLDSAATWVINMANNSLPYLMANEGYDVWLANSRGNIYSLKHKTLSTDSVEFWDFNFDQMALYDLPAIITSALNVTGAKQLTYIGHSQGSMIGFALFSSNQVIASKIKAFVGLAPVAFVNNIDSPLLDVLVSIPETVDYFLFGKKDFMLGQDGFAKVMPVLCQYIPSLCTNVLCLLAGCENNYNFNNSRMAVLLSHFPAGTSVQDLMHFRQAVLNNKFQMYDYGFVGNVKRYNQPNPPTYDLTKFSPPSFIFSGLKDTLADPKDVQHTLQLIPRPVISQVYADWGHADFVWGLDAAKRLYIPLLGMLRDHEAKGNLLSTNNN